MWNYLLAELGGSLEEAVNDQDELTAEVREQQISTLDMACQLLSRSEPFRQAVLQSAWCGNVVKRPQRDASGTYAAALAKFAEAMQRSQ